MKRFLLNTLVQSLIMIGFISVSNAVEVALHIRDSNAYHVDGSFSVEAPRSVAWDVLADYDHIHQFVSSMKKSRVVERKSDLLLIEQEAKSSFMFFSKEIRLLLEITESPQKEIVFNEKSGNDFSLYKGSWTILEGSNGTTQIQYSLDAKRKFFVPGFIARSVMKKSIEELLEQVQAEIQRRATPHVAQNLSTPMTPRSPSNE